MIQFSNDDVRQVILKCDEDIIPIFPVRFAIKENALIDMLSSSTTPATPTGINDLQHHELLRIRRGYVYVFADGDFHVFQFETQSNDENGCMHDPNTERPPSNAYQFTKYEWVDGIRGKWKPSRKSYPYLFVPKDIPKAWVAYSEHRWPYRFLYEAETNFEFRNQLMTLVDLTTRQGDFCAPITELEQRVPAFRRDSVTFSAQDYSVANAIRHTDVEVESSASVIDCQNSKDKGVLVALHDPISELKDMQGLMSIHSATLANYVAEHQYPLVIGQLVKRYADKDKVSTSSFVVFDGPLLEDFADEYDTLVSHANDLEASQVRLVEHWANKVAQTAKGSLYYLLALSDTIAHKYSLSAHPKDHTEVVAYWLLYYARMSSSEAHSQTLSKSLNVLFDPSNLQAPHASTLKLVTNNLQKALGFVKPALGGSSVHHTMLSPAINAIFTLYGTEIVRASTVAGSNATQQLTTLIYQSQSVPYANQNALKNAFKDLMRQEGYSEITLPNKAEQLGTNIHAQRQMTPTVNGPKPIHLVEFHAQIDLSLDDMYLAHARNGNNFDLATNGIGVVAAGLSLYTTMAKWNDARRNAGTIGDIVSRPGTQLTAAFAEAYASIHGVTAALVGRSNTSATNAVLTRVFGNNAALSSAVASNASPVSARAAAVKSLSTSAKIAGGVGVALSVGLAIEGYQRGDNYMFAGNTLMAAGGLGLLFITTGPFALVLLAVVIIGLVVSLFAYDDAEQWVLAGFWGTSERYWETIRSKKLQDQLNKAKVLGGKDNLGYNEIKKLFDRELAYFVDINASLTIKDISHRDGLIEIHCATLQTAEDLSRLRVDVRYDPPGFSGWRYMPSIVFGLKRPGIAWAKIPNGYYSDINTFEVLAELDRVPNGTFKASETFQRKQLW